MKLLPLLNQAIRSGNIPEQVYYARLILQSQPPYPASLQSKALAIEKLHGHASIDISSTSESEVLLAEVSEILQSTLFDEAFYSDSIGISFESRRDACKHFCLNGWQQGHSPSELFNTKFYLASNPDIRAARINPLSHYLWQGNAEGRHPTPPFFRASSEVQNAYDTEYVGWHRPRTIDQDSTVKFIAFYLPQFHEIEENNKWWGEGFTEWTNVKRAKPLYPGHRQPKIPGELGYYDLSSVEVIRKQVRLASAYGVHGFCLYFYWFEGKTLLEKPLELISNHHDIPVNFCLCWANENWTRSWDGLENDILIGQNHSAEDDINFIAHISRYLADPRYIRVDSKPLLIVYRPSLLPNPQETVLRWRQWCNDNGIGDIFVAMAHSFDTIDPRSIGFDCAIEFAPNNMGLAKLDPQSIGCADSFAGGVFDWNSLVERSRSYRAEPYPLIRCINPGWDNSPRKGERASVLVNNSPRMFVELAENAYMHTCTNESTPKYVFINAWNEWAEGAILEPTYQRGYAFLEALRQAQANALSRHRLNKHDQQPGLLTTALAVHAYYPDLLPEIFSYIESINCEFSFDLIVITTTGDKLDVCKRMLPESLRPVPILIAEENRGRDVRPFLETLSLLYRAGIKYVCKIHTKKSLHREDGDRWRKVFYDALLCNHAIEVIRAIHVKNADRVALLAPPDHLLSIGTYLGHNEKSVIRLGSRLGFTIEEIVHSYFPAGSMYWATVQALVPLLSLVDCDKFQYETGQTDGTYAHAIERIISLVVRRTGYISAELDEASPLGYRVNVEDSSALFKYVD
jgi:lipopolysaccharide biosynthesis protein